MGDDVSELFDLGMRPSMNSLIFQFLFYGTERSCFSTISSFKEFRIGAYIILGGVYVSLQLQQRKLGQRFQHPFYPVSLLVLFVLATGGIIISVYDVENIIQEFIVVGYTDIDPTGREKNLGNYRYV
ncbi:hypothetical protein BDP27DRAFT_323223 [Rhodocollybia butyracea]|uniref:Uncharacterized protein n=1 Tax=Rhodocollybia butyracea TaxID=206335 RepID=A0A9P5PGN1_9AGAR|nr:hypothetical protein BDP27DRAFT_323223 [Rhodocollybia butyracea]